MKSRILFSVLLTIFLFIGNFAFAQVTPAPVEEPKVKINCKARTSFTVNQQLCYKFIDYATEDLALAAHKEALLELVGCNDCPELPNKYYCFPTIIKMYKANR